MPRWPSLAVVAGLVFLTGVAQAQTPLQRQMDAMDNPADKAFLGAMHDLMVGLHRNIPMGETDSDFARLMLPYDQAAIDIAKAELQYGKDETLKAVAKDIVATHEHEIALLQAWAAKRQGAH